MSYVFYVCEAIKGIAVAIGCFIAKRKNNAK